MRFKVCFLFVCTFDSSFVFIERLYERFFVFLFVRTFLCIFARLFLLDGVKIETVQYLEVKRIAVKLQQLSIHITIHINMHKIIHTTILTMPT